MAMQDFDREDFQAPMAEINTTPLVDVMLVLLVIFLVTAPMLTQSINLKLPAEAATDIKQEKVITISLNTAGQYYWDNFPISDQLLEQRLGEAARANAKQPIHIRADKDVPYGKVSHVLAVAQRLGLSNIGFLTEPK